MQNDRSIRIRVVDNRANSCFWCEPGLALLDKGDTELVLKAQLAVYLESVVAFLQCVTKGL